MKIARAISRRAPALALALAAALLVAAPAGAATIQVVPNDGPGEGFNDPTPELPVGGNNATTRGGQRLRVFQEAAAIWSTLIPSDVTIRVRAEFNTLTCDASSAVLGSAGPNTASLDFAGAPFAGTWYHAALANRLAGRDLTPGTDDIFARFNSAIDNGCLGSSDWYYGLDHGSGDGNDIDLLAVVLHELGHGLGFSTLVDMTTGAEFDWSTQRHPDIFERFLLDTDSNQRWHEMTDAQRAASVVNTGDLVWAGNEVTSDASEVLDAPPLVTVNSPPAIAGTLEFAIADFGARPTGAGISADVVLASPATGCQQPLSNAAQVAGRIALVDRGSCEFVVKARAAQAAGAVGVLVANNVAGAPQPMSGSAPDVTIPVIGITLSAGNAIKGQLAAGVNVTIGVDAGALAGADEQGRVRMYAPNPREVGSSVSHWDVSATPNLLMEPFINSDLGSNVDLTLDAFVDLGWLAGGNDGGGPSPTPALPPLVALSGGPNPFNTREASQVTLSFVLDRAATIDVHVTDLRGRLVKRLFTGPLGPGAYAGGPFTWDGTDEDGRVMDAGIYFARVHSGKEGDTRKFALIR